MEENARIEGWPYPVETTWDAEAGEHVYRCIQLTNERRDGVRDRALLAECRKAIEAYTRMGVDEIRREGRMVEVLVGIKTEARALLTKLDAQDTP